MANIRISQLPTAPSAITGAELVPIVQNGETVQATVNQLVSSPSQTQTFLTVNNEPTLPNSRYFGVGTGIGITDSGAQGRFSLFLNGTSGSLEVAGYGLVAKTGAGTIAARTLLASGAGLSVTNGNGISGNPTIAPTGLLYSLANLGGTGLIFSNGSTLSPLSIAGTTNQINVASGNGVSGNPTVSFANDAVFPGTGGITVPNGTTGQRPIAPNAGQIRYNTTLSAFEFYEGGIWQILGTGSGTVTQVNGTANQINVVNNTTTPTVSIVNNPTLPGVGGVVIPIGTTAQRPGSGNGTLRYNTDTATFEGYANGVWGAITTGTGVTSVATGTGLTGGPITTTGTIAIANTAVSAGSYGGANAVATFTVNPQGQLTLASNVNISIAPSQINATIPNSGLTNSSVTYNGVTVALGASGTITASTTSTLTIGTGLSGGSFNGSTPVTIANTGVLSFSGGTTGLTPNTATTGAITLAGTLAIANGGTGLTTTPSNGQIDIGNGTGFTRTTLTAGTGITITNGAGSITPSITATGVTAGTYGSSSVIPVLTINAQGQVTSISTQATNAPAYQGTWNANTNSPTLTSSVGTSGYYYVVTTAGNTTLNGVSGWNIGDWVIFSNGAWQKIPGSTTESFTNLITTNLQVGGLTGFVYANNTTGYATAATTAQLLSLLGTTPVANGGTGLASLTAGSLVYGNGTSAYNTLAIGTNGQILTSNGTAPVWSTLSGVAVTTFSGGTTGLTPSTATSGAITLGGTLVVANGGTGLTSLTAGYIPYGNGTSAFASSSGFTFSSGVLTAPQHVATLSVTGLLNQGAFAYGTLGYSDTNIIASFASSINSYNQMVLQNTNAGAAASTNFNVSNDAATSSANFGEFGINSSVFSGTGSFSGAGNVYLASASGDLVVGTYASKYIRFVVNSGATDAAQITPAGNFVSNGTGTFVNGIGGGNF